MRRVCHWLSVSAVGLVLALFPTNTSAENLKTESRMPHSHRLPLRDADGQLIALPKAFDEQGKPQEAKGNPLSTAQTCGKCHEYEAIGRGWHFNAANGNAKPGRPGEPWILTDQATYTQIPLSYRGWAGTFKPADVGLTDFDFINTFGHHFPGGGVGEVATDKIDVKDAKARRFLVTGKMEIDCFVCHESSGRYDHETRYRALGVQNIKWMPSLAMGLGTFGGSKNAKAIADSWRPPRPAPTNLPSIKFERAKFDSEDHVNFEVTRRPSSNPCYYCHTSDSSVGDARWHSDRDVHLRAGMVCVDCHRNGIDHMVVRGYEGELKDRTVTPDMIDIRAKLIRRDNANISEGDARKQAENQLAQELSTVETLSCRGCHMGAEDSSQLTEKLGSRLGAPRPTHIGLPPVHLERLACTACHSGPFPGNEAQIVHTSLAHKLGIPAPTRGENMAPIIVEPAFLRGQDGKITPHKMMWPSYWAHLKDGKVKPMLPEEITAAAGDKLPAQPSEDIERDPYNSKPLTDQQIQQVLEAASADKSQGETVFIAAGKMYRLDSGKLRSEENDAAKPYSWPLAHDVRPAKQALGARGCPDCHTTQSPIYFGTVLARGPVEPSHGVTNAMWALRGDDRLVAWTFASSFVFRPMLKVISFGSALVIVGVLFNFSFLGLGAVTGRRRPNSQGIEVMDSPACAGWGKLAYGLLVLSVAALAVSGIGTFAIGKAPMTHWVLMAHASIAPVFAIALLAFAVTWSDYCRFSSDRADQSNTSKLLFWVILIAGLVVILSGAVPMTPVFGTPGQHALYLTHRYSGIVVAVALILHMLSQQRDESR